MNWLWGASDFVRKIRSRMRFGERSRAPLHLLRLELQGHTAQCDWLARLNDPWDMDLPQVVREQNETFQALRDAITVRHLLFASLPDIQTAEFRVYRQQPPKPPALIITGNVSRDDEPPPRLASLVMQAKLCGLRFSLAEGVFEPLNKEGLGLAITN